MEFMKTQPKSPIFLGKLEGFALCIVLYFFSEKVQNALIRKQWAAVLKVVWAT
jgi:hypothetical protein